jgi:hypothetical protein
MDGDHRRPQARGDLAGRRITPGPCGARPRLRDHASAGYGLSTGAAVIEALVLTGFLGNGRWHEALERIGVESVRIRLTQDFPVRPRGLFIAHRPSSGEPSGEVGSFLKGAGPPRRHPQND